jgi:hypothetical protein
MPASSWAGLALLIWAATVDPADVPMIRSASVTSSPASNRPAMTPISHALPADPPPPKTSARSPLKAVVELECSVEEGSVEEGRAEEGRAEEGVVFMGVASRELPGGRSRWRLAQSRDRGRRGSTHCGHCEHGSHLLPIDHDRGNASTPATRCATDSMPVAGALLVVVAAGAFVEAARRGRDPHSPPAAPPRVRLRHGAQVFLFLSLVRAANRAEPARKPRGQLHAAMVGPVPGQS